MCDIIRSERSNYYETMALDLESGEWVIHRFDRRKPFDRFVPEHVVKSILDESGSCEVNGHN